MRFVEHQGDPAIFDEMKALSINIHCLYFSAMERKRKPMAAYRVGSA